jgi:hypothetical protein
LEQRGGVVPDLPDRGARGRSPQRLQVHAGRRHPLRSGAAFSGGGHFTHRFAILHPGKLWAASIGASGSVTLLDPSRDWWVGIRDIQRRFGIAFDREALARVPVQMLVGDADLETWEITHKPGGKYWMEGANDAGRTRPERLRALAGSFREAGVEVTFELVPGVSHERTKVLHLVEDFLAGVLRTRRAGKA